LTALPAVVLALVVGWLWPPPDAWYQSAILVLSALAPDLDRAVGAFSSRAAAATWRGRSHSIPALALWAGAIAIGFHAVDPHPGLGTAALLASMGVGVHALVDLASPAGLALFGRRRLGFAVLAPQDVVLVACPVLTLGLGLAWEAARLPLAVATCLLVVYWVGLRLSMRRRALAIAREALGREPEGTFPTPWNPFRWIAVAPDGDARLVLPIDVAKKKAGDPRRFAAPRSGPIVDALASTGALLGTDGRWTLDLRYAYRWPVPVAGLEHDESGAVVTVRLP